MQIPKNYNPKESEDKWQKYWEKEKIYKFKKSKNIFSIDTPPPTVSGKMHIGHASQYSQMDFIARYKRMNNFSVFYPFGTDDNGLATIRLIEKEKNVKAFKLGREKFIKLVLQTLEKEIRPNFIKSWKDLAISCDYSLFYSTIDKHSRKISQQSFIDLYKIGREYRKEAPIMWCPECQTAIAQVEMEDKELSSQFNNLIFTVDNKKIEIATTRPELLPACVAVFAHPEDERYKNLIGKKAKVPLFNFEVPILADDKVDTGKGTGIVMCCTFGDITDIEWFYKHKLPLKISITKDGKLTEEKYKGLAIKQARKQIIQDLKKLNLITKQEPITHSVNVHERCGTEVEFIVSKQWFIKYLDLKKQFIQAGKKLNWNPDFMRVRYENWIKGLQWDWCISRQRYYGIPFPVWYCKNCKETIVAEEKQLPVDPLIDKPKKPCQKCGSKEFIPEKDVLDTWATSSLTPQLAIKLINKNLPKEVYPMNLRPQAHDIITFWLFNTVVKSLLHEKKLPWKDIMISGFVLDPKGKKMSKSKGNVIDPKDIINLYGADALRFWAASTKLGADNPFKEKEIVAGQKFITKLWNAAKLSFLHLKDYKPKKPKTLEPIDLFLLSKLQTIIENSVKSFENYEYSRTKSDTENFFWHTFCDNYLEIIKDRLYNPDKYSEKNIQSVKYTLYISLLTILKLIAPIMPHITEEIYQLYFKKTQKEKSIHISSFPKPDKNLTDKKLEIKGDDLINIISKIRQFKQKKQKSLRTPIILTILKEQISPLFLEDLKAATNAQEIKFGKKLNIKLISQ